MKIAITAIVTFVVTGLLIGGYALHRSRSVQQTPTAVRVENPRRGDLVEIVSAPGAIEPRTKVSISARVSARIIDLPFREGQSVTKGDPSANPPVAPSVLVRLDDKDLQADLRSSQSRRAAQVAQIEVAKARLAALGTAMDGTKAQLTDSEHSLHREEQLRVNHINSEEAFDQARCRVDKCRSDLATAENTLRAEELNMEVLQHTLESLDADVSRCKDSLTYTVIASPIDGVVTRLQAEVGEMAIMGTMNNPGTEILQVADLSAMLLVAEIDEAYIGSLAVGQKARVKMQAYGEEVFAGQVDSIAMVQTPNRTGQKFFLTKILLAPCSKRIFLGLTGDVEIETRRHQAVLMLPSQSVVGRSPDDLPPDVRQDNANVQANKSITPVVFRMIDGKSVMTPVKIGATNSTYTEIVSALAPEDRVVVGPYKVLEKMSNGMAIAPEVVRSQATSQASWAPTTTQAASFPCTSQASSVPAR